MKNGWDLYAIAKKVYDSEENQTQRIIDTAEELAEEGKFSMEVPSISAGIKKRLEEIGFAVSYFEHLKDEPYYMIDWMRDRRADCKYKQYTTIIRPKHFENEAEAIMLLNRMYELVHQYSYIAVSAYYSLIGCESTLKDTRMGWSREQITKVDIIKDYKGYILTLPDPINVTEAMSNNK